jgi:PilZ domain
MLEVDNGQKLMQDLWNATPTKVQLPESMRRDFFKVRGAAPLHYDNRRSYHRYYMRGMSVLKRGEKLLGTYTKDLSRQGVGFLSPEPLLPKERVKLRVNATELSLEVTRCRRVEPACFECGGKFVL